ncbi:hypothetical protein [Streptomyces sp. SID13726]|uniref:hypothetical protein n=1 Tax=Streptomyces sp. SID13726 TaxID=2706058 RepID=UPI0013B7FB92|nr:hypothetical protein [Streptomyces sp. SID13726]NEB01906.1 hypothetical protein [Streptomyces sp. SID13726]
MIDFPGSRPMCGDTVKIIADALVMTITGAVVSRGVLREGYGFVELVLPDGDPQQRRDLERAASYQYRVYVDGALLYSSPPLRVHETRRESDGSLVVVGSP